MPIFGSPETYMGVDIGTSTCKIVELIDKKKRIEIVTYAESNLQNLLVNPPNGSQDAVDRTVGALKQMIERAQILSTEAVAALPGGAVFSTVLKLPVIPEPEMENAVRFAAKDIIPADIDEMVLGWSRVGGEAHMTTDIVPEKSVDKPEEKKEVEVEKEINKQSTVSVFITAAPKDVVNRYIAVFEQLQITLLSLEVETFSLARSLLSSDAKGTILIDFGSRATTYHIIDGGIPRVSHTIEYGGYDITKNLSEGLKISEKEAEQKKSNFGLSHQGDDNMQANIEKSLLKQVEKAQDLISLYEQRGTGKIAKAILIGGGANLPGLSEYWSKKFKLDTSIGDPWKGLAHPTSIEAVLKKNGPRFGVSVGLALRSFAHIP